MTDLQSKRWIVAKGGMFLVIASVAALLLWLESPSWKSALLLLLLVWAACRFYYFLFYVLEKYVDPSLRYPGILALVTSIRRQQETFASNPATDPDPGHEQND